MIYGVWKWSILMAKILIFMFKKMEFYQKKRLLCISNKEVKPLLMLINKVFLHRDVKPPNILFCENTKKGILIDFGLAREFVQDQSKIHTIATYHGYAPIEQYKQQYKRGSYTNVYALAATLYYFFTEETPISSIYVNEGFPLDIPQHHNPKISNRTNNAIFTGMELLPDNRPQSMEEWLRLLDLKLVIET